MIEIHYLPSLEYFAALLPFQEIILEKKEWYVKQSFRNRCQINAANSAQKLILPITAKSGKALISEVKIDHSMKWQNLHWRAIRSAYGKAPYFEHYGDKLHRLISEAGDSLYELNFKLLSFCLQSLGCSTVLSESESFEKVPPDGITDLRNVITPKNPFSQRSFYTPVTYLQVFGNKFVANLSIIDLLFCEGPNSIQVLRSSSLGYLNK